MISNLDETSSTSYATLIDEEIQALKEVSEETLVNIQAASEDISASSGDMKASMLAAADTIAGFEGLIEKPA